MILDQCTITKLELEEKVRRAVGRLTEKQTPPGGPLDTDMGSDGKKHSLEAYQQRLFNWLVRVAGTAPREEWKAELYKWCEARRVVAATAIPPVTRL